MKQEFIPTNVDEAEFEISVNGPEGTNLAVMNETITAMEKDILETPGVRLVLSSAGGGFLGGVNQGDAYVRIAPHEERTLSFIEIVDRDEEGKSIQRVQRKLHATGRDAGGAPATTEIRADA